MAYLNAVFAYEEVAGDKGHPFHFCNCTEASGRARTYNPTHARHIPEVSASLGRTQPVLLLAQVRTPRAGYRH